MALLMERFGDYELVRYLTAGGMADLYLATTSRHPSYVVVKKIQPRYSEMTRIVRMFIDEGRIAQALDHPNIVKIVDVGREAGTYFIAMEYINGRDLLQVCRRGLQVGSFLPRHLAVAALEQALRGLAYAHEKVAPDGTPLKIVHCDVSPGNLVLSWGGTTKIVDFGIARATIQLRSEDHSVAGKYNYMAPEQIRGEPIDGRADVFAIGVILYEVTVGKRLFRGAPAQVMRLVLEEPIPRPSATVADFPPALEAIVMRALERDPERRYPSARALREALRGWLAAEGRACSKRELATYLRAIYDAPVRHQSDEFGDEDEPDLDDEDDELVLEEGLPSLPGDEREGIEVDAEDPEETVDAHVEAMVPTAEVDLPRAAGPPGPMLRAPAPPSVPARVPPSALSRVAVIVGLSLGITLALAALVYFLKLR